MTFLEHLSDRFDFGKFYGRTLAEVLVFSPSYLSWIVKNVSGRVCKITDSAMEEIKEIFPNIYISDTFERQRNQQLQEKDIDVEIHNEGCNDFCFMEDEPTYERYNGSYAQDEMGYSDDDIDTIFDGDPSAYWNID